jgi:transposase
MKIESGVLSVSEVMKKYKITNNRTVSRWVKRFGNGKGIPGTRKFHSGMERRQAIIEIENGKLTDLEVLKKYRVSESTLYGWKKEYSSELASKNNASNMENKTATPTENSKETELIKNLKLKVSALETMIDIAETQYNIDIRKKFGSKQ